MIGTNVEIYSDDVAQKANGKPVKLERNVLSIVEEHKDSNALSNGHSSTSVVEQGQPPMDENTSPSSMSPMCAAPLCRQFWKAGNYDDELGSKTTFQSGKNHLHVHPKFLHSNATSHKWVFGAVAELLDNAMDEIENKATFVLVDKLNCPRDGSLALLIQDDGGGMDPDAMRRCMSFGFSEKKSNSAIGQYGNGFKTSSMRLGADVIVFSRHLDHRKLPQRLTQSIGLISYTFLTQEGYDRIVVPMVDYEFSSSTEKLEPLHRHDREHFKSNLSLLLRWSPYSTEAELLEQFNNMGHHGTKVIIYNLWLSDDGNVELDFDSDPEDICVAEETRKLKCNVRTNQHIANRFRYSLRVYLSILYLKVPENFRILLRGQVVEHHNIANDLIFPEFILYKPQSGGCLEGQVVTTIGFLKEVHHVNVHGFNVYHKNRLIMPFWQVLRFTRSRGRGVVGVLQANFIEPTHNKQDFERTSLFQKLEVRLREMAVEYWDYHCGLIGYHVNKKRRASEPVQGLHQSRLHTGIETPVLLKQRTPKVGSTNPELVASGQHSTATSSHFVVGATEQLATTFKSGSQEGVQLKRTERDQLVEPQKVKRQAGTGFGGIDNNWEIQPLDITATQVNDKEALQVMEENKKLRAQCLEYEEEEKEFNGQVTRLQSELQHLRLKHARLLAELQSLDAMKSEKHVNGYTAFDSHL